MAHFSGRRQHFTSQGNTRYKKGRNGPIRSLQLTADQKRIISVLSFRLRHRFCNINPKYVNMADINLSTKAAAAENSVAQRSSGTGSPAEPIGTSIEWWFFAYGVLVAVRKECLLTLAFGRAHHRVLHFVNRNPGIKVADLLEILNITKQSLGRVLKQLIDQGYVSQKEGAEDRRQRLLFVTGKGESLALKLATLQTQRISRAFGELGPNAHEAARRFLTSMIDVDNRDGVLRLIARADRASKTRD